MKLLERLAVVIAAFVLAVGIIAVLSGGLLAGRDTPGIAGLGPGIGTAYEDLGHVHLRVGARHPRYDSMPPTSGAHVPVPVTRDRAAISDDQLLQALETGDVVFLYAGPGVPAGLAALAARIAPRFTPALAAAGQAVILARRPGTTGILGVGWTRMVHVTSAADPLLAGFARFALGRGAPGG
ncbi:MAG: hypothetical protein NVS3B18_16230 [Candidatus Dormibacteria bacterium]